MIQPSLALIPTGYKDGKLYSVLPESGAGDFDVVRGSGATRVNKEGLVEDVRILSGELVTNGDFATDSDWTKDTGWSISGGSANCDGIGVNSLQQNTPTIIGKTYKLTFDVISDSTSDFLIISTNFGDTYIQGSETIIGANTFYITPTNGTGIRFRVGNGTTLSITNISVKEVTEDTNIPRLDYTGGGCPSLLLEPLSTNLITHSEDFSDASWIKVDCSVVSNFGVSPSGQNNASKFTFATTNIDARAQYNLGGLTTGNTYTQSYYIKSLGADITLRIGTSATNAGEFVDIVATSEWQRFEFSGIASGIIEYPRVQNITGTSGVEILIWGAQLEALPYATSYIPTSGQIASRLADIVTGAGDATTFNSTEGVLYAEMSGIGTQGALQTIGMFSGDVASRVLFRRNPTTNKVQALVYVNNIIQFNVNASMLDGFNKVALKYKENDFALWLNGVEVGSSNSGLAPVALLSKLSLKDEAVGNPFFGKAKDVRTFNTALTDAELIELTTI